MLFFVTEMRKDFVRMLGFPMGNLPLDCMMMEKMVFY